MIRLILCFVLGCFATSAIGQELFLKNQLQSGAASSRQNEPVKFSADFKLKPNSNQGVLNLRAEVAEHWHIYSVTQPKGGPMRSKISIPDSKEYKVVGAFSPDKSPKINKESGFDVHAEEHEGVVVWSAPIELAAGVKAESLELPLTFNGQVCESKSVGSCKPLFGIKVKATFAGYDAKLATVKKNKAEPFPIGNTHARVVARLYTSDGKAIQPGDRLKLEIQALPEANYHVYAFESGKCDFMATRIGFTETSNMNISGPKASTKIHLDNSLGIDLKYHEGKVAWTFDVEVPQQAEFKSYPIHGVVGLQTCDDERCDPPAGAKFVIHVPVGTGSEAVGKFEAASYRDAKNAQKSFLGTDK